MKRNLIKLTEGELNQIVENSVRRIISENMEDEGFGGKVRGFFKGARDLARGHYDRFKRNVNDPAYDGGNFSDEMRNDARYMKNSINGYGRKQDIDDLMKVLKKCMDDKVFSEKTKSYGYAKALYNSLGFASSGVEANLKGQHNKIFK